MRLVALILILAAPAALAECPASSDIAARETALFDRLKEAGNEMAAREMSNALWELWTEAPDAASQELLDQGMARRASFDFIGARDALDRLIEYCPTYAEGWNQRAFVAFLVQDFEAALKDLDAALALNPRHVGALSGKALTLIGLGEAEAAQIVLREALALNPWLSERHLLTEPPGEDI